MSMHQSWGRRLLGLLCLMPLSTLAADANPPATSDAPQLQGVTVTGERSSYVAQQSNLTDEKIYDGYYSTFQPRAPRSVDASIAVRF